MMSGSSNAYSSLIQKLDQFIRKYYTNEMIRGAIFSAIYILVFFQAINVVEYYFYLPTYLRKILFFGFIFSSVLLIINLIVKPLMSYYRLGKVISHEQASLIIGQHFAEVKDKLLNILQLKKLETLDDYSLVNASINQKITELKPISFSNAIDLNQNKRYLKYLLPPLLLFVGIIIAAPNIIKQGTKRLYYNDTAFEKEAPFKFELKNKLLQALQYENFVIQATTSGDVMPSEMYVEIEGNSYKMRQTEKNNFEYELINLQKKISFQLAANGFRSKVFLLDVIAKPLIKGFEISADYPAYIGKPDEVLENVGDLNVPAGTRLSWKIKTQNTTAIQFLLGDSLMAATSKTQDLYTFSKQFLNSNSYTIKLSGEAIKNADSLSYNISVVPDLYPQIEVAEKRDSINDSYFYYLGNIADDYGIKRLTFNFQLKRENTEDADVNKSIDIVYNPGTASAFQYYWNIADLGIKPGDKMTYYFEVWDNDAVYGSKSSKSSLLTFNMPTTSELQKELEKGNKEIKDDLKKSMKDAKDLKNKMQELQEKLLEKKNLNWEDKKNINDVLSKQKELEKQLQELKEKFNQNIQKKEDYTKQNEAIKEKQKQLQELFNAVMNDDMKKLYDKLQKMLEDIQKKDAIEKMDDMKQQNEKAEKELDRMLELFKKLELQQKMEQTIDKLEKLAEKQEQLAKESEQKNADSKDLKEKQEKLNEEMKQAQKDLQDIEKLSKENDAKADTKDAQEDLDKAEQDMKDAADDLQKQDGKKAAGNQKSAAQNMKSAAQKLSKKKAAMEQEESEEDMQALRQLLKNILSLSFDQEKLIDAVKAININNPKYPDLIKEQQRIRENSLMVQDSLYALSKRVFQIKSFVTKQITDINKHLGMAISDMAERNTYKAAGNQQFVMTALNNLALMLSETQQEMQQQMSDGDPKDGPPKMCKQCKKPGSGMPKLSQMQKQLGDKITQLAEQMKKDGKGEKSGQQSPGKQYSKEFAEMAAQQSEMRRMLEKLNSEENKDGKGSLGNLNKTLQQMEQNETDLVNKRISTEMLKRQQEITVRLLEAEKAQRERDEKPERESSTGKELERKMPPSLENYLKQQKSISDIYKTVPPTLKPFYKSVSEKYFKSLSETK
jgi:hypothetical protein